MPSPKLANYFVSTADHEILSEAVRLLEDKVNSFLAIGCELGSSLIVNMQQETFWTRKRFYVSQATFRKLEYSK